MEQGRRKLARTLQILQNGYACNNREDAQLLKDLREQLSLYCTNLQAGDVQSEVAGKVLNALPCLEKLSSTTTIATTTLQNDNNNNHNEHETGITSEVIHGQLYYFLDGMKIHFKVLKNKPKNGDFKVRWNQNYEALKEFKTEFGTTRVTRSTPGHKELGNWVAEQRRKLKKGKITQKQFEMLNDLGFEWDRSSYFFNTHKKKGHFESEGEGEERWEE